MKKLLLIFSIFLLANCAKDLRSLKAPQIEGSSNKSASIYFDKDLKTKYIVGSKAGGSSFSALDVGAKKSKNDISSKEQKWSQNVGELSIKQFNAAFKKAFASLDQVSSKNINKADYLIVPSIVKSDIEINKLSKNIITIAYKIDVYDKSNKIIYSDEQSFKQKGKRKKMSVVMIGPVPVFGEAELDIDDSSAVFEIVSDGVDKMVNKLISSQFIKNN